MASIVSNETSLHTQKSFGASVRPGKERTYKNTRQSFGVQNRLGFFFLLSRSKPQVPPPPPERPQNARSQSTDHETIDTIDPPDHPSSILSIPYRGALLRGLVYHHAIPITLHLLLVFRRIYSAQVYLPIVRLHHTLSYRVPNNLHYILGLFLSPWVSIHPYFTYLLFALRKPSQRRLFVHVSFPAIPVTPNHSLFGRIRS